MRSKEKLIEVRRLSDRMTLTERITRKKEEQEQDRDENS